ncbi:hypothetical protein GCM10020229_10200 [Kitasatospora albolonga]
MKPSRRRQPRPANPRAAPGLQPVRDLTLERIGCCGLSGGGGMNRHRPCGAPVGTEISDCSTPYELHLGPGQVRQLTV